MICCCIFTSKENAGRFDLTRICFFRDDWGPKLHREVSLTQSSTYEKSSFETNTKDSKSHGNKSADTR